MKPCRVRGCGQPAAHDAMCLEHVRRIGRARSIGRGDEVAREDAAEREAIVAESKLPAGENLGALGMTYGG